VYEGIHFWYKLKEIIFCITFPREHVLDVARVDSVLSYHSSTHFARILLVLFNTFIPDAFPDKTAEVW